MNDNVCASQSKEESVLSGLLPAFCFELREKAGGGQKSSL